MATAQISADLQQALQSSDWEARATAAKQLILDPNRTADEDTALVLLLAREDDIVNQSLHHGKGAANDYGEDYADYTANLAGAVQQIAEKNPDRTDVWPALVHAAYEPGGAFVRWMATHSDKVTPVMLADSTSADAHYRSIAIQALGTVLATERQQTTHKITPAQMNAIESQIRSALKDRNASVRIGAIEAMTAIGTSSDVALLQQAANDPETGRTAQVARQRLQQRLALQQP